MPLITIIDCENCHVDHEWLFDGVKLSELRMIKKLTGMSQRQFAEAGDEGDPEALAALIYILHIRDKIKVPYEKIDVDFKNFKMEPTEQEQKEIDEYVAAEEAKLVEGEDPKEEEGWTVIESGPTDVEELKPKS